MAEIKIPIEGGMFDSTEIVETAEGYPRGNKAVDASFFAKMISCFYKDGVWGGDSFAPIPGGGLNLKIGAGIAWIRGYMAWLKADTDIALTGGKTYSVVLRLDTVEGEFNLAVKENDSSLADTEYLCEIPVATVTVPATAETLTANMITDLRERITSTVEALETVETSKNSEMLGGLPAKEYLKTSGGTMTGELRARSDASGMSVVRNIGYGTSLPESMADGDLFILLA